MANCVITGTLTAPIANAGPTASLYIGSPVTYAGSDSLTRDFSESKTATLKLTSADGETPISMDSVAVGDVIYLGCNYKCTFKIDGSAHIIGDGTGGTSDGGLIMISGGNVATLTVEAALPTTTIITVAIFGA